MSISTSDTTQVVDTLSAQADSNGQSCKETTKIATEMGSKESILDQDSCAVGSDDGSTFPLLNGNVKNEPDRDTKESITASRLPEIDRIVNDEEDSATESLPPTEEMIEEPHDRSDGSDSGLGSELSEIRSGIVNTSTPHLDCSDSETFDNFTDKKEAAADFDLPSTSFEPTKSDNVVNLQQKAKAIENDIGAILDEAHKKQRPLKGSLKRKSSSENEETQPKCKKKRGISFDSVTVYYFPRAQGFTCVPSQGGSTLGMGSHHSHIRKFSISEHASEQRRAHRQLLQQLRSEKHVPGGAVVSSSDDSDSEEEPSDTSETELDLENYNFLQPVPTRQRRLLLRSAGVRKIDSVEKDECRDIRTSREFCGCGCKGYCDPDTCSCSQAGIKCQVDRLNFPCGCSREYCGNSSGRIEFNPVRVRTHFIHTLMRLELEKKQKVEEDSLKSEKKAENWMENERLTDYSKRDTAESSQKLANKSNGIARNGNKVESCLHDGNFTNLHYGPPGEGPGLIPHGSNTFTDLPAREDSLDLYAFREDCYQEDANLEGPVGERKPPTQPFSPGQGFHFPDPRFSDVGYPAYPASSNQYSSQPYQSGFADFAAPVFSPYGGMYVPEFGTKPLEDGFQSNGYDGFGQRSVDSFSASDDSKENHQYTSLVSMGTKAESFADYRYGYGNYEEAPAFQSIHPQEDQNDTGTESRGGKCDGNMSNSEDCDENFGEIIKKSMVETVSA